MKGAKAQRPRRGPDLGGWKLPAHRLGTAATALADPGNSCGRRSLRKGESSNPFVHPTESPNNYYHAKHWPWLCTQGGRDEVAAFAKLAP